MTRIRYLPPTSLEACCQYVPPTLFNGAPTSLPVGSFSLDSCVADLALLGISDPSAHLRLPRPKSALLTLPHLGLTVKVRAYTASSDAFFSSCLPLHEYSLHHGLLYTGFRVTFPVLLASFLHPDHVRFYYVQQTQKDAFSLGFSRARPLLDTTHLALMYASDLALLSFYQSRDLFDLDWKYTNNLSSPSGIVYTDFEFVWPFSSVNTLHAIHGKTIGTPLFSSPEQINAQAVSHRTLSFQFACSFICAATGDHPRDSSLADSSPVGELEVLAALTRPSFSRRVVHSLFSRGISQSVINCLLAALAYSPEDRPLLAEFPASLF